MAQKVTAHGQIKIIDDEFFTNETGIMQIASAISIDKKERKVLVLQSKCVGGEVRVEFRLDATHFEDGSVQISGTSELYEGTSCDTTDLEVRDSYDFKLKDGESHDQMVRMLNEGNGGDLAQGTITFRNNKI